MNSDFSINLRKYMNSKKFTGKMIAEKVGVSTGTVIHWANGRRFPNEENIQKIANALNIKISDLFGENIESIKTIPLIGLASCGVPSNYYHDEIEQIPVTADVAREGVYALRAEGNSMEPSIKDGDIVICDKEMPCENGSIVHYTTIDGESGLKKYSLNEETRQVTLFPLNTDFTPVLIDMDDIRCAKAFKLQSDL